MFQIPFSGFVFVKCLGFEVGTFLWPTVYVGGSKYWLTGRPPYIDQKVSLIICMKMDKNLSAFGAALRPHGSSAPDPHYRLTLLWAYPGSAHVQIVVLFVICAVFELQEVVSG